MKIYETELPGVGVRYTIAFETEGQLVVLIHNDRRREVFWREDPNADAERLFSLDGADARKLSDILEGTYFQPVDERLDEVFEDDRIRWIHIDADSPVSGQTISEASTRSRTGVTILGIRRGETIITDVAADTRIEAEDILVGVGSEDSHEELRSLLD